MDHYSSEKGPPEPYSVYDRGPYDPEPLPEEELWFVPPQDDPSDSSPSELPLPQADQRPLVDVSAWFEAERSLAVKLANLGVLLGRLAERLQAGPPGWRHRLALREAADLSWLCGDRVPIERLALWLTMRVGGEGDDAQALARAGWAARRLLQAPPPREDLAGFLGRTAPETQETLDHQIADWGEVMGQGDGLHAVTQGALSFHIWPIVGLSAGHPSLPLIEAGIVAARHVASTTEGLGFLPLALGGAGAFRGRGTVADRLSAWINGAEQATRAALRHLDVLNQWNGKARVAIAGYSGRTPSALLDLLGNWPLISAPMAEAETGASRAAVQRNLNRLTDAGLIREVTGQGRYRYWAAQLT